MEHRTLGRTGVQVSPLCLGAMMFGAWGNPDHDDAVRIMHRATDAGINFIDTADAYTAGESEEIVGKFLAGVDRSSMVVATKFFNRMGEGANRSGNSRRWIVQEVDNSLRRLGTDYIDLYQAHRPDPTTEIEETLSALTDLVRAGKIRYFGHSTFPAHEIVEAQWAAARRHTERFVTEQPPYSMLVRGVEADVLPVCGAYGIGVIPWSPLGGGWLSGRFGTGKDNTSRRADRIPGRYDVTRPENQRKLAAVDRLQALADEAGLSLVHLALAFVIQHPAVSAAIIGPRTMEHLEDALGAVDVTLGADLLDRIDEIVPPGTNFSYGDIGYRPPALVDPALRRRR